MHFILAAVLVLSASCGHGDSFRVKGTVADSSSINIRFVYYTDGDIRTGLTASIQGEFEFEGNTPELAAVEVYDNDYRLLGRFMAANGDDIDLTIDRKNMYLNKMNGNKVNKALTEFYNANAESLAAPDSYERNKIIVDFVAQNPSEPIARLLVATELDASSDEGAILADSLLKLLDPAVADISIAEPFRRLANQVNQESASQPIQAITYKAPGNHTTTFAAQRQRLSVIAISDVNHGRDSVLKSLRKLANHEKEGRMALLDLNVDADTMVWKRTIRTDSATWEQGWVAGSISGMSLERLGIPGVPYFIMVDSAGNQLWRGRSATEIVSRAIESISDMDQE